MPIDGTLVATLPETELKLPPLARRLLLFAPLVLLGNAFGALVRLPASGAAVLFLPYAVVTAFLILAPARDWVWYLLVAAAGHFITHWPRWGLSWVLFADTANIARALTAAVSLRAVFRGTPRLDSIRALLLFVGCAVFLAPAVGATIGAANAALHGALPYATAWKAWYLSSAVTGMTLLPALLYLLTGEGRRAVIAERRVLEIAAAAAALAATCAIAFLLPLAGPWHDVMLYAPLPVLIWVGLRFGTGGASVALTATTIAAIWGRARGNNPFDLAAEEDALVLQLFAVLTSLPVLCIAAVSRGREDAVQLYGALLDSLSDHVAILDRRGVILEVNDSWRQFTSARGTDLPSLGLAGDNYLEACRQSADRGNAAAAGAMCGLTRVLERKQRRFEIEFDDEPGSQGRRFALRIEALERADGGAVVTQTDVTARRQTQLEIEEQQRELTHLARVSVLGQLSGALAHELNQPLSAIHANAEAALLILQHRSHEPIPEIREILDDIVAADQRAALVIRRLAALLKRGEARLQPLDTRELVADVLDLAHGEFVTRRVVVTANVPAHTPAVRGDRVQVQQVLLNLILNGCEAMADVPATDRRLLLNVEADGPNHVHFAIRDRGTGIPAGLIDRVFEPFVTTKPEGMGLGLSISRTIVAAHGGRLWAENNRDQGATMHCVLATAGA
ncbi:MAG TPA: MASE1 domain-containing protein [Gemmatimonadales bacterium]|nr:MASE1 domain-containing protein [Gemmatimonadales bacterium]